MGQRTGISIPASNPCSTPLYVIGINASLNTIVVGSEEDLFCNSMVVERVNWITIPS
ncbi:MAG: tRNA 2-thiouridine(34) synthase MnmA, partial [Candidatus Stahlbacteria bacterium]|nr:tRNA 2-thiouridine(34) synthase MnmA [Candidatus Stahlbacteria bacterium]